MVPTIGIFMYLPGFWELIVLAAIALFLLAPLVVVGVVIWFALGRGDGDRDR